MATKKKTKRAAAGTRVVERKPVEVATPSVVESSTVETLVQVMSPEEIEKTKAKLKELSLRAGVKATNLDSLSPKAAGSASGDGGPAAVPAGKAPENKSSITGVEEDKEKAKNP